jgi:hypothetical protein
LAGGGQAKIMLSIAWLLLNITVFIAGTPDNGFQLVVSITGHRW